VEFINGQGEKPFFMMLATPSCHVANIPAPQYEREFSDVKAPRSGSFNIKAKVLETYTISTIVLVVLALSVMLCQKLLNGP